MANSPFQCQECGCHCDSCHSNNSLHLHREIEDLKKEVRDRELHIVRMETSVLVTADKYPNGEFAALNEEMQLWQDRYERLLESHRKLQRVNQGLEDKLLKIVDKYETEKNALNKDVANLTSRLVEARVSVAQLEEENEQYRNDCNIAIQLLQCKPSNFVAHKLETFPVELQQKARVHLSVRKSEGNNHQPNHSPEVRTIRVPIPTFPPTAMVYSVSNGEMAPSAKATTNVCGNGTTSSDIVSAAIMAKVLEEREKERSANGSCCAGGRKAARCPCKCRNSWHASTEWDKVTVEVACQTRWSIPKDAVFNGRNADIPQEGHCHCNDIITCPHSLSAAVSGPAVHSQRRLDATDLGSRRKWMRSGSSTSTETEI